MGMRYHVISFEFVRPLALGCSVKECHDHGIAIFGSQHAQKAPRSTTATELSGFCPQGTRTGDNFGSGHFSTMSLTALTEHTDVEERPTGQE